jgi:malonate-semialdehyde dehydrogenase (acetylating)/methylmalonate-semialdehyde dehydrogenase
MQASTLEAALEIVNASPYGNGAAIFTQNGSAARQFVSQVTCGQVGVNIPIPVAMPYFSFTGWKGSFNGALHFYGKQGVEFFTRTKTVTASWKAVDSVKKQRAQTSFPTSKPV